MKMVFLAFVLMNSAFADFEIKGAILLTAPIDKIASLTSADKSSNISQRLIGANDDPAFITMSHGA